MLKRCRLHSWVVLALAMAVLLAGCAPPSSDGGGAGSGGRKILPVTVTPKGEFGTQVKDGVEFRVARGPVGKPGGTFYTSQIGDGPKTFNPWASFDATSSRMGAMMLGSLLETDAYTGDVVPYLAKSFTIDPDNMTYRVTLRKGLTWSDGKPLTTEDVVFTWNEILGKGVGNPSARDNMLVDGKFPTIRALDKHTVEFKTAKPFAPFLRGMGGVGIAPKHVFEPILKQGGDKAFSAAWGTSEANKSPEKFVSSGMWLLDRYDLHERVTFKRNPHFFMVDREGTRLPYLERYDIKFVKDLNNEQLQFEQGNLDLYPVPGHFVSHVRTLKSPQFNLYDLGPATGTTFLTFNLNARKDPATGKPYVDPVKSQWFNNVHFRQAMDWAINREDMVANILKGIGAPLFTPESPSSIFLNEQLAKGHPQDVAKAKELLKTGGFSWDPQGRLVDAQGNRVEFTLYTNTGNDQREATGVNIKQDLEELGIKVHFKPMEFNVLVNKLQASQWEAMVLGLTGGTLEPNEGANVWMSYGALHMFNQRDTKQLKLGQFPPDRLPWEVELDKLFVSGAQVFEKDERKAIYDRYQEVVAEQVPFIYLFAPQSIVASKARVKNLDPTPLGGPLHNLEELWVDGPAR